MINYLVPSRIYHYVVSGRRIRQNSRALLPAPYNPSAMLIEARAYSANERQLQSRLSIPNIDLRRSNDKLLDLYASHAVFSAGAEIALLYGLDVYQGFASVDHYVYESMERLTNEQFDSFADLSHKISEYQHSFWSGLSENGLNKIGGHLGEVYAAEDLERLGANVEWPDASNQTGWDLLINGHELNVKLVSDYGSLSEHFAKYPDIPVLIPGDAAHIPADAVVLHPGDGVDELMQALSSGKENLVIVDQMLDHDAIMSHAEQATDTLLGSADTVSFHIPIITALFSGWREANLLIEGRTELLASAKNFTLDVAGTGIGGFAGAKAGAAIGTFIAPGIGTAIGGIVGAIGGAIFGRKVTNHMKNSSLNEAMNEFRAADEQFKSRTLAESEQIHNGIVEMTRQRTELLQQYALKEKSSLSRIADELRQENKERLEVSWKQAHEVLQAALSEMAELEDEIHRTIRRAGWFKRVFFPNPDQLAMEEAARRLRKAAKSLNAYYERVKYQETVSRSELYAILAGYGVQYNKVAEDLRLLEQDRVSREAELRNHIHNAQGRMIRLRVESIQDIARTTQEMTEQSKERLAPLVDKLNKLMETVRTEANKLGHKV